MPGGTVLAGVQKGSKGAGLRAVDWDAGERGEAPREGVLGPRGWGERVLRPRWGALGG